MGVLGDGHSSRLCAGCAPLFPPVPPNVSGQGGGSGTRSGWEGAEQAAGELSLQVSSRCAPRAALPRSRGSFGGRKAGSPGQGGGTRGAPGTGGSRGGTLAEDAAGFGSFALCVPSAVRDFFFFFSFGFACCFIGFVLL